MQAGNTKEPRAIGRPSGYSVELAATICLRMAEGETLRAICRDEDMPARSSVYKWLHNNSEFSVLYALARERLVEHWADEMVDIADDGTTDYVTKIGRNGAEYEAVDQEHIQRSRLRVDTRKWLMSKLKPGLYGEHLDVEHSGSVDHNVVVTDRERMRRFALFMVEDQAAGQLIEGQAVPVDKEPDPK